jgi:hypothetical protein
LKNFLVLKKQKKPLQILAEAISKIFALSKILAEKAEAIFNTDYNNISEKYS